MSRRILVTGGAGFIGSHLTRALLRRGHAVRVLDALEPQVHGPGGRPAGLEAETELLVGDVRDPAAVRRALAGADAVFHLAAAIGVGQSMYQVARYTETNALGTAVLLEALIESPVERLVAISSMSVYGEGLYRRASGAPAEAVERTLPQLAARQWEVRAEDGEPLVPVPTPETKTPSLASVYALSKYDQERLCLLVGRAYRIPVVALRLFNVYGPGQALSNPYTGVLAIFAARLLNGQAPLIFEDGEQRRDFVSVHDVVDACCLALEAPDAAGQVANVGSGTATPVREIAERLGALLGKPHLGPEITGRYRTGDIRHCFADIDLARQALGYAPRVGLDAGLRELAAWLDGQVATDRVVDARRELAERGLTV
jgi:dTDP-L-rhamnose 4-epimerase